jgi:hypothetical protein
VKQEQDDNIDRDESASGSSSSTSPPPPALSQPPPLPPPDWPIDQDQDHADGGMALSGGSMTSSSDDVDDDSGDDARWREKPRDSHSATSASDPSGTVPHDPPDHVGQLFAEKKPACLAKRLKPSVTRDATEDSNENDDKDAQPNISSTSPTISNNSDDQNQNDDGISVARGVTRHAKTTKSRRQKRKLKQHINSNNDQKESEAAESNVLTASTEHKKSDYTPGLARDGAQNNDLDCLPKSYCWLEQPPSVGDV